MITYQDILYPKFWCEPLLKKKEELDRKENEHWDKLLVEIFNEESVEPSGKAVEAIEPDEEDVISRELLAIREEKNKLLSIVNKRYEESRPKNDIVEDVKLVVNSITQKDYKLYIEESLSRFLDYREMGIKDEDLEKKIDSILKEGYEGCFNYILSFLDLPLTIFIKDEGYTKRIMDIVEARVSKWYEPPESNYLPVLKGKATDLAKLATKSSLIEDKIAHTGTFKVTGEDSPLEATIRKFDEYRAKLSVSTDQLLNVAIANFSNNNHIGEGNNRILKTTEVRISLKDYARARGIDIDSHPTSTPEEKKREAERVKKALKRARKSAEEDLEALATTPLSWEEKVKGKRENFIDVYPVEAKAIIDGYIYIKFTPSYSSYLLKLPMNQFPKALLLLDSRQSNAYMIGKKLTSHYFMDSNQLHNRADILRVKILLKETNLPSIDKVRANRNSWVNRKKSL